MNEGDLLSRFHELPAEARRPVLDFIDFLHTRYAVSGPTAGSEPTDLAQHPFIGMWKDREDMKDSTAWVRRSREEEWGSQVD
ncbi:MAG: hypothetical protein AB1646_16130 [Thermodesulfobacteriota bacterium]